jgi:hypothetical protein
MNAYMLFVQDYRPKLISSHPELKSKVRPPPLPPTPNPPRQPPPAAGSPRLAADAPLHARPVPCVQVSEVGKLIGEAWRTLAAGERTKYQDKAAAAKATWTAANPGGKKAAAGGGAAKAGKAGKAAAGGEKVKRAPTPYIKFSTAERVKVIAERPDLASDVKEVAKIMGARWRALSEEQKKAWA